MRLLEREGGCGFWWGAGGQEEGRLNTVERKSKKETFTEVYHGELTH